jgi:hypothetical protein
MFDMGRGAIVLTAMLRTARRMEEVPAETFCASGSEMPSVLCKKHRRLCEKRKNSE